MSCAIAYVPIFVGFMRGFAERRFLTKIPLWVAEVEWGLVVLISMLVLCIPNSKSDPHGNFMTVFGAFFMILVIPSVALSMISFAIGIVFGKENGKWGRI